MPLNYRETKAFTVKIGIKYVSIFISLSLVSACSSSDRNWPNLSDKLPDASERERTPEGTDPTAVTPSAKPAPPPRPAMTGGIGTPPGDDPAPQTVPEANILLEDIKKALREETLIYRQTVAKLGTAAREELQDIWFSAQLALTRLSRTASRLDPLTETDLPEIAEAASAEADIIERFVVGERQRLADSEPD